MNAIGGFVPASGSVRLGDEEIGDKPPAYRAGLGLGRTFQSATLFPELTVTETLLVALEGKSETGVLSTALALPRATRRSRRDRAEVGDLVELLGLDRLPGPLHRRPLDRYPARGGAGRAAGARRQGAVPRRAHGRAGATRDRGLRPAHRHRAAPARRVGPPDRARHAAHHGHQRPGVLPRGRERSSPRAHRARCATTPGSSPATSAPTSGPSTGAAPHRPTRRESAQGVGATTAVGPCGSGRIAA